jgi:hypothetical protein
MSLPPIPASEPVVKPAEEEITYNQYWVANLRINAGNPNQNVRLIASFIPFRHVDVEQQQTDENGDPVVDGNGDPVMETVQVPEFMPGAEPKRLVIDDLIAEAALDPTGIGAAVNSVLTVLTARAQANGII